MYCDARNTTYLQYTTQFKEPTYLGFVDVSEYGVGGYKVKVLIERGSDGNAVLQ